MDKSYTISKKEVQKVWRKIREAKRIWSKISERAPKHKRAQKLRELTNTRIEHLCGENLFIYRENPNLSETSETYYWIWDKEMEVGAYISEEKINPKSVREMLHNIEENKEFYKITKNQSENTTIKEKAI